MLISNHHGAFPQFNAMCRWIVEKKNPQYLHTFGYMLISNHGEVFCGSNKSVWNDMEIATWMGLLFLSVIANEQ